MSTTTNLKLRTMDPNEQDFMEHAIQDKILSELKLLDAILEKGQNDWASERLITLDKMISFYEKAWTEGINIFWEPQMVE